MGQFGLLVIRTSAGVFGGFLSQVTIVMPPREAEDLRQELVSGQGTCFHVGSGWRVTCNRMQAQIVDSPWILRPSQASKLCGTCFHDST